MAKFIFTVSRFVTLATIYSNLIVTVKTGQHQREDLSVI